MYEWESKVRYSEIDSKGHMSLQSVLDYFQDCSTFHSEDIGLGVEYLKKQNKVWLLSAWQIVVDRYPKLGEHLKVVTFPYGFKGFFGYRNFYMEDQNKVKMAYANSVWTLMDLNTMKPSRIPPEMEASYILSEKLPMEYAPRKIANTEGGEAKEPVVIRRHHLDTNHHVNNGQYLQIAMDYLPEDIGIKQMRAEYKKSAVLGDVLIPLVKQEGERYLITLIGQAGEVYVIIELYIS